MQSLMLRFIFFGFLASQLHIALCAASAAEPKNEIVTKGGMFDRAGADISGAQKAIAPTARVLAAARQVGLKIIYLKMGYHADLSDLGAPDSVNLKFGVGQTI